MYIQLKNSQYGWRPNAVSCWARNRQGYVCSFENPFFTFWRKRRLALRTIIYARFYATVQAKFRREFSLFANLTISCRVWVVSVWLPEVGTRNFFFESAITIPKLEGNTSAIAIPQFFKEMLLCNRNSAILQSQFFLKSVISSPQLLQFSTLCGRGIQSIH